MTALFEYRGSLACYISLCKSQVQLSKLFWHNFFFSISIRINMCFGYLKEPSHRDGSFDYPQHMLWLSNMKNNIPLTIMQPYIWRPDKSCDPLESGNQGLFWPLNHNLNKLRREDKKPNNKSKVPKLANDHKAKTYLIVLMLRLIGIFTGTILLVVIVCHTHAHIF